MNAICSILNNVKFCIFSLAKNEQSQAVICLQVSGLTIFELFISVRHNLQIDIMNLTKVNDMKLSECKEPNIDIFLPSVQKLNGIVKKHIKFSRLINISVNFEGLLMFTVATDNVNIKTE
ncbi:hypothetical protein GYMLUDRAFT_65402 [Collybiopsis luxurians FD-317 M1]|uniref:Checkpoint protein n=1 Tax=Collybiopsis luxurians FD-317 M1 TaxID=944289 RepID=A0A0D0B7R4_9AGAR|nr:hypothetical protein GYMLUDRAFT_65402 [Collybiopsis luxurians FD-317 M1]